MTIQQLIAIAERRLVYLSQARASAESIGDIERVSAIDADINETNLTLNKLKTLV